MATGGVPLVLVLDLDGTIVGDVSPQVCEYELLEAASAPAATMKLFKADLQSQLTETALLRPRFRTFARTMTKHGAELFVYTASDTKWANVIVPAVEAATGVQFNRPLFTRKQCRTEDGVLRKPVKAMLQSIFGALRRKKAGGRGPLLHAADLAGRVVFIDNSDVMLQDAPGARQVPLLRCPTYAFRRAYDVLRLMPPRALERKDVWERLQRYGMCPRSAAAGETPRAAYYRHLSELVRREASQRARCSGRDRMWEAAAAGLLPWCSAASGCVSEAAIATMLRRSL